MRQIFKKIWKYFIRAVILGGLFAIVFFGVFYLVNLDLNPGKNNAADTESAKNLNLDAELSQRLGSTTFSMESYGQWAKRSGLTSANVGPDADPDKEGLPNYLEYVHGTDPLAADSDGDKFSDKQEIINGYDPDAPGDAKPGVEVSIVKINVAVPMIWSRSEKEADMLKELENGVGHYFKTAAPGQIGNAIISGHSSNYIWAKGDHNHIFKDLDNLQPGDIIVINTLQKNGRNITYRYEVSEKFVTVPNDGRIFAEAERPILTLSTCWPIGTNFRRLIVKAELLK